MPSDEEHEPREGTTLYQLREFKRLCLDLLDAILDALGLPVPDEYPRTENDDD